MIETTLKVLNKAGIHARPASSLVKTASHYKSEFYMHLDGYKINGKSILGVMTLAAEQGCELGIELEGEDEKQAFEAIKKLFETGFGEEM
ncbi:MAG: HPr family phosphocarrier protein [Bacteroidetes bacterium]|nr:HPr family phosphocarrier protein [Bacteroidota bacterium]NCQ12136.1 HPr family phosphocarrier protein [Bacteroidota bacterium]